VEAALDADDANETAVWEALDRRRRTGEPHVCLTSPERIRTPVGELTIPPGVDTLDWEVEIAVVIGANGRDMSVEKAANVIAGYCAANDLTVRSEVTRADLPALGSDWVRSKGMPGSLPLGPWFVPAWQAPDASQLRLRLSVNDTSCRTTPPTTCCSESNTRSPTCPGTPGCDRPTCSAPVRQPDSVRTTDDSSATVMW